MWLSERGGGLSNTELLATVPGSHLQQPRSIQAPLRPRGAVQGTASPAADAWQLSGLIAKVRVGGGTFGGVANRFSDSSNIGVLQVAAYTPTVEAYPSG